MALQLDPLGAIAFEDPCSLYPQLVATAYIRLTSYGEFEHGLPRRPVGEGHIHRAGCRLHTKHQESKTKTIVLEYSGRADRALLGRGIAPLAQALMAYLEVHVVASLVTSRIYICI